MTEIKIATINHIPELVNLLNLLFDQEEDFIPDTNKQRLGLMQIIVNPDKGHILALLENNKIIGMVNLLYTISTALGGKVAILEDMILDPEKRGSGQGTILLQAAIDFAKQKECLRITLLTDVINKDAIRFYQKLGFVKSGMTPLRLLF